MQAIVAGKMTPCLQLTDTDFAFLFKAFARQEKDSLMQDKKVKAQKAGTSLNLKVTSYDILKIIQGATRKLRKRVEEDDLVLKGLRRNGNLVGGLIWRSVA